jgi:DNA-binding LytR/AlgR family response regulator
VSEQLNTIAGKTMTPTAILADDEPLLRAHLREKLAAMWPELCIVGEAANGVEAAALVADKQPDIAFLDIKMPGQTGIEVAQGIETHTRVVFVTAYDQYAVAAFENEAVDYVLKPVHNERLAQTVARIKRALETSLPAPDMAALLNALARQAADATTPRGAPLRWIRANRGDTTYQISVDEVQYFQSDDKYTVVNTPNGEHLITKPLSELVQQLDAEHFWQVHRGTVVNLRCIVSSKRDGDGRMALQLRGVARPINVSRAYQHLFKQM